MSRDIYEALFHDGSPDELLKAFAQAGRRRAAAEALATDEMMEGSWVELESLPEAQMRLAADDRSATEIILAGGGYSVHVRRHEDQTYTVEQTSGPGGASLRLGEDWVVLSSGAEVPLPVTALPGELTLVDKSGKEIKLS